MYETKSATYIATTDLTAPTLFIPLINQQSTHLFDMQARTSSDHYKQLHLSKYKWPKPRTYIYLYIKKGANLEIILPD